MVMTLENELEKFFDDDSGVRELDLLINKLVDNCMYELNKREKLKYVLNRGMKLGSSIMNNSIKFMKYIPGRRYVAKGVKKTASKTRNLLTAIVKKRVGELLDSVR